MPERYSRSTASIQHTVPPISDDDLAAVLADFSARRDAPTVVAYFSAVICDPFATPRERDAALATIRSACIAALLRHGANPLHAACFVVKQELRARESMRSIISAAGNIPHSKQAAKNRLVLRVEREQQRHA